jgi:hypothetical protein
MEYVGEARDDGYEREGDDSIRRRCRCYRWTQICILVSAYELVQSDSEEREVGECVRRLANQTERSVGLAKLARMLMVTQRNVRDVCLRMRKQNKRVTTNDTCTCHNR